MIHLNPHTNFLLYIFQALLFLVVALIFNLERITRSSHSKRSSRHTDGILSIIFFALAISYGFFAMEYISRDISLYLMVSFYSDLLVVVLSCILVFFMLGRRHIFPFYNILTTYIKVRVKLSKRTFKKELYKVPKDK